MERNNQNNMEIFDFDDDYGWDDDDGYGDWDDEGAWDEEWGDYYYYYKDENEDDDDESSYCSEDPFYDEEDEEFETADPDIYASWHDYYYDRPRIGRCWRNCPNCHSVDDCRETMW